MHTYRSRSMPITPNICAFEWESELWEFTCRLSELSLAPRAFSKVMKPLTSRMRRLGQINRVSKACILPKYIYKHHECLGLQQTILLLQGLVQYLPD